MFLAALSQLGVWRVATPGHMKKPQGFARAPIRDSLNPLDEVPKENLLLDDVGGSAPLHKLKTLGKDPVTLVAHQSV